MLVADMIKHYQSPAEHKFKRGSDVTAISPAFNLLSALAWLDDFIRVKMFIYSVNKRCVSVLHFSVRRRKREISIKALDETTSIDRLGPFHGLSSPGPSYS